jgi:nitrate reductase assembly molybdenum cofactor insertion protein NarJ
MNAIEPKAAFTPVQLAAQSDLVLLTVEMLRAPPRLTTDAGRPEWTTLARADWESLLSAAGLMYSATPCEPLTPLTPGRTLATALAEVFQQAARLSPEHWSDEYWRLFDSTMACPINQAAYIRRDKGAILGDVAGFYAAFGWRHDPSRGERPDHLLCQLEFVAALLAMAGGATTTEQSTVTAEALAQFARVHMHDWLPSFAWQLCEASPLDYFGAVGNWLVMLWDAMAAAHAWPVDVRPGEYLEPTAETENPYECAANGLVQLGDH